MHHFQYKGNEPSSYSSRYRVAELVVNGASLEVIRERETVEDLIRGEKIPAFLQG